MREIDAFSLRPLPCNARYKTCFEPRFDEIFIPLSSFSMGQDMQVELDRGKVGLNVTVFSRVKLAGHGRDSLVRFEEAVREYPEVLECYTMMGDTDFLLRIVVRDIKAYEAFFLDHLSKLPGVES